MGQQASQAPGQQRGRARENLLRVRTLTQRQLLRHNGMMVRSLLTCTLMPPESTDQRREVEEKLAAVSTSRTAQLAACTSKRQVPVMRWL